MHAFPPALQRLLARVAAETRLRRAERGAWRGAFWGALAAVLLLATQGWAQGMTQGWDAGTVRFAALALLAAAMAAGAAWGASRRIQPLVSARLADRALGLQDRLSTALECSLADGDRTPLAGAQLADTVVQIERIDPKAAPRMVPRLLPREARYLALPLATIAVLLFLPPLPAPAALMQAMATGKGEEQREVSVLDRVKMLGQDLLRRQQPEPQEAKRNNQDTQAVPGEAEQFKDRALKREGGGDSDFASFAKKGDERLRLLERADKLPDLQSDFASSQYRAMAKKMGELAAAKGGKMSDAKMGQILREMEKMGRKANPDAEWNEDMQNAMRSFEEGDSEGAMEGMQQAMVKMQTAEEKQRASQMLNGGRDGTPGSPGGESGDFQRSGDPGYSEGKGGGPSQGAASARLRSTPYDAAISGARKGRAPTFDTGSSSRPGALGAQLQYRGEIGQYRRQMEDAIAREQVPRDYHNQIRDYFKSLQE